MQNRIFIGPIEVAGFCSSLGNGFEEIGWEVNTLFTGTNPFGYCGTGKSALVRRFQSVFDCLGELRVKKKPLRVPIAALRIILKAVFFLLILPAKQNYVFIFGQSLLPLNLDIRILRWVGRKAICVYLGTDSRTPYLSGDILLLTSRDVAPTRARKLKSLRAKLADNLARVHRCCSHVVDNPMSGILQSGKFLNWFSMGFPTVAPPETALAKDSWGKAGPLIIHAPSFREIKGSDLIESILKELADEGVVFRYRALSGVPNREVKALLAEAHVVIDQLYSDTPLAGLGTEAASYGCAVVVGGYGWEECSVLISPEMMPPSLKVDPENFKEDLRKLLTDEAACAERGRQLHRFVKERWNAATVAGRYAAVFAGEIPPEWWIDPQDLLYTGGMGATRETIRVGLAELFACSGKEALGLGASPSLERKIIADYGLS